MREFSFKSDNTLQVTENHVQTIDGEEVVTTTGYTIAPQQLAAHLPMFFGEMPLELVIQAHSIVASLPK